MPLVYQQNINEVTKLAVWHITESEDFFLPVVTVSNNISHPHKRLQHLAGRYLLVELFEDFPLELIRIADTRKPFLPGDPFHFSISHCGVYAAAIVSRKNRVGVDIETVSMKIEKIKHKFLPETEQEMIFGMSESKETESVRPLLTLAWSIKETLFKWYGDAGVDFIDHLKIESIAVKDNMYTAQCIFNKVEPVHLKVNGLYFSDNFLTWVVT